MSDPRTFIAVPLPEEIRETLGNLQKALSHVDQGIKWVDPDMMHITLKYLGETPRRLFDDMEKEIEGIVKMYPGELEMQLQGLGTFPTESMPRVLWAGVTRIPKNVYALSDVLNSAFLAYGFENTGKKFIPHITLGRVKSKLHEDLTARFYELEIPALTVKADSIIWYESCRRNGILRYDPIRTFKL